MGHVDVLLDDALQVSLPVVPPQDISSMDLEIRMADGSFITDAAPSNLVGGLAVRPLIGERFACGELPVESIEYSATGDCTLVPATCPGGAPRLFGQRAGTCEVTATHSESGASASRAFTLYAPAP